MLSFLNAAAFMIITVLFWGSLTAIFVFAAFMCGLLLFILLCGFGIFSIIMSISGSPETSISFIDNLLNVIAKVFLQIPLTVARMWNWGKIIPEWVWEFARYDHPWIALIISLICLSLLGNSKK